MEPISAHESAERCLRLEERLRILSETTRSFAESTGDSLESLLDTVARRVGGVVRDYCAVHLLSEDGRALVSAAMFDPDPHVLRQWREVTLEPLLLETHPLSRAVVERGEPHFAPRVDLEAFRARGTLHGELALFRRIELHGLLLVPLRVRDRVIGQLTLARYRPDSPPFSEEDLDLAQMLATHAALAVSNSLLLRDARRESDERQRMGERFRALTDVAQEFSASTGDYEHLLELIARRLGEVVGDACGIRAVAEDGQWLEARGASYHPDPEVQAALQASMTAGPQRIGEGLSGRAVASGQPALISAVDPVAFARASDPQYRALLERLQVTSTIVLPLRCRGTVVGVANLMRSGAAPPYGPEDLRLVQGVAEHAALAIGNARSYAAERRARDAAEKATAALDQARARFGRLSEAGVIGILVSSVDGRIAEVNEMLANLVGYSRAELLSGTVSWRELSPPEWRQVDARAVEQLDATGIAGLREKEYIRKDGTRAPVLVGSAMLEGDARNVISFVLDLTGRKEAEAAIEKLRRERADDAKSRALLEAAPDAMVIVGQDGRIVLVNAQAERQFGYSREQLLGQPVEILVPERFRGKHARHRGGYFASPRAREMGSGLELHGLRRDGSEFPIEISLSPLETADGVLVSSAIRDITERKRVEEHAFRLAAIVEYSDEAIIGKTLDGVITSWNGGAERIFGYVEAEVLGKQHLSLLVPAGREAEEAGILAAVGRGEAQRFDTVRRRKDGREIDVSVTISPVRDVTGRIVAISKVARDITERRRAELALAQAKDAAEASSRELEAFSYSVAHDLRAPLRGMNGFAQVLLDSYGDKIDAEGQDWLQEILLNAKRMGHLIDALLSLSRVTRSDMRPESVDLSALVRATAAQLSSADPGRHVALEVEDNLRADVDPFLARALVENLVGNAWKFTSKVTDARIDVGATNGDGGGAFFVRDNGAGFDMAYANKLFTPFQRLHSATEFPGTGIGLATVQRIVRRHGGRVWAEGAVNRGATFYVALPSHASGAPPA